MALSGRIEDFGLTDLFQLLISTAKSGTILLQNEQQQEVTVQIRAGMILYVHSAGRPVDVRLGSRLVRSGQLSHQQFGEALRRRSETGQSIVTILNREGLAAPEDIAQLATLEATDILLSLFTWQDGSYAFEDGPVPDPPSWMEPISADYLLMQGFGLISELPEIEARVPSILHVIAARRPLPRVGSGDLSPDALFSEDILAPPPVEEGPSDQDRFVHALALPGADIQSIVDRAPVGRYDTYRSLSHLIGGGYLTIGPPYEEAPS